MSIWNSNLIYEYQSRVNQANASIKALRRLDLQVQTFFKQQEAIRQEAYRQVLGVKNIHRVLVGIGPFVNTPKPGETSYGAFDRVLEEKVWIGGLYAGV